MNIMMTNVLCIHTFSRIVYFNDGQLANSVNVWTAKEQVMSFLTLPLINCVLKSNCATRASLSEARVIYITY